MSEFSDKINQWHQDDDGARKPRKREPSPAPIHDPFERSLAEKLDEMALMLKYGFWNADEHHIETSELLQAAAIAIRTYEDLINRDGIGNR